MDVLFLMNNFQVYPGLNLSFEHICNRGNFFQSAYFCWDAIFCLSEVDQKVEFGGVIRYRDSYLEFSVRLFKVFRLNKAFYDAVGAI